MTTYYYDKEARTLLAVDDRGAVSILEPINPVAEEQPLKTVEVRRLETANTADKPKFSKGCPECGSPSRHRKDCLQSKEKQTDTPKRKLGEACKECGSLSRRHKLGCPLIDHANRGNNEWAALDKEETKRADLMSERQYGQVKTAHNHGMDPTSIAHEMNLKVKEVNTAILSKNFAEYSR